jgi:hypothetical protein
MYLFTTVDLFDGIIVGQGMLTCVIFYLGENNSVIYHSEDGIGQCFNFISNLTILPHFFMEW